MLLWVIAIGLFLIVLERVIPDQKLPAVKGWWLRVVIINLLQLGVIWLAELTWEPFLQEYRLFKLGDHVSPVVGGLICYLVITFVFYWWHRWRHEINFLWLSFHQVHHSPQRIETITSFYKHPLEIVANSIIIGAINFIVLGLTVESAAWNLLFTGVAEYFYHMNIRTPHWVGYFLQRPEMHRIHHERGKHYNNFADLPVWDMLFGTFKNPKSGDTTCGFEPERERRLVEMMFFKNVNNPFKKR